MQHTIFQLYQRFGRCTCNLYVGSRKIEHIRRRVNGTEYTVSIQETSLKRCAQSVGQHNLEDISLTDMVLCLFDHAAELLFVKQRRNISKQLAARFIFLFAVAEKLCELTKFHNGLVVAGFRFNQRHIYNENDFLSEMIECDNFIKEHQINILKCFGIFHITFDCRLAVSKIIIGKVSHKTACKGREIVKTGTLIIGKNLAEIVRWIICLNLETADLHFSINASDLHFRVKSEKGVVSPVFICLCGFQHIAMRGYIFQYLHRLNGCSEVGKNFKANRQYVITSCCCDFFNLGISWLNFHNQFLQIGVVKLVIYWDGSISIFGAWGATNVLYTAYRNLLKQRKDSFDFYLNQRSLIKQKRP